MILSQRERKRGGASDGVRLGIICELALLDSHGYSLKRLYKQQLAKIIHAYSHNRIMILNLYIITMPAWMGLPSVGMSRWAWASESDPRREGDRKMRSCYLSRR